MRVLVGVLCLIVALSWPAVAAAHPGHGAHKVMGTVTHVAADHVMIKTQAGKEETVKVTPQTKVRRAKASLTLADLQVGSRVVVNLVDGAEQPTAKDIEVGTAPAKGK